MKTEVRQILGKQLEGAVIKHGPPRKNYPASMLILVFEGNVSYEFYSPEGWIRPHQVGRMGSVQQLRDWGEDQLETLMIAWLDDDGKPQIE